MYYKGNKFFVDISNPIDVQAGKDHVKKEMMLMDPAIKAFCLPAFKVQYEELGITDKEWEEWTKE